ARIRHRAIVDDGYQAGSNRLADAIRIVAGLLAVEVGFEAMTDRLVQEDAGVALTQYYRELAGRRVDGRLKQHRLSGGIASDVLGRVSLEVLHAQAAAAALDRRLTLVVFLGERLHIQADHRLEVLGQYPLAGGNRNVLHLVPEGDDHAL